MSSTALCVSPFIVKPIAKSPPSESAAPENHSDAGIADFAGNCWNEQVAGGLGFEQQLQPFVLYEVSRLRLSEPPQIAPLKRARDRRAKIPIEQARSVSRTHDLGPAGVTGGLSGFCFCRFAPRRLPPMRRFPTDRLRYFRHSDTRSRRTIELFRKAVARNGHDFPTECQRRGRAA
jgi:hypothetical protein